MAEIQNAIFIIARLNSTRVPNKNIADIDGMPMISRLCQRLEKSKLCNKIIVCTSNEKSDDLLEAYCKANNILVGRGSLDNVMERICSVADFFNVRNIIEVLGDNPFVDAELVDEAVSIFQTGEYDYVANASNDYVTDIEEDKFPTGIRVQIYSKVVAKEYLRNDIKLLSHPSSFLYVNPEIYSSKLFGAVQNFKELSGYSELNISVNYPHNLDFARKIFRKFGNDVSISQVLLEIAKNPSLRDLVSQKNG